MRVYKLLFLSLAMALAFQSCKTTSNIFTMQLQGKWNLVSIDGQDAKQAFARKIPTLQFDLANSRIAGNGGCNTYGGSFTLKNGEFHASNVISTMMACAEPNRESDFLRLLSEKSQLSLNGDELILVQNGKQALVFTKAKPLSASDLTGEWKLQSMQGSSANVFFGEDFQPTLKFDFSEMRLGGNAGCNNYSGTFELEDNQLKVGALPRTKRACDRLQGEDKFINLLIGISDLEIEGDLLYVRRDGRSLFVFTR